MDPSEEIVTDAIVGGDHETGMRRLTCNQVASRKVFCDFCGTVLDQRMVNVFESARQIEGAVCDHCLSTSLEERLVTWAEKHNQPLVVHSWDETRTLRGEIGE